MPNYIVTVTRPVLTEEERQKRMDEFKRATADFLIAVEKNRTKAKELEGTEDGKGNTYR